MIELDVGERRIHLDVADDELNRRMAGFSPPAGPPESGYARIFHDLVEGADSGADFTILKGCRGSAVPRDSH